MALTQVTSDVVGTLANLTVAGNLTISGSGQRIQGDFSNSSYSSRTAFQTSTTNNNTALTVLPNGSGTASRIEMYANSDPTTSSYIALNATPFYFRILSSYNGPSDDSKYMPIEFHTGGQNRLTIDVAGNVGVATDNPASTLEINGLTTLKTTTEILDTKSSVTGTVVHDFSTSAIWYYSNISGAVTANITNVPTTDNRVTSVSIVVNQGGTGYIVNGLQINGSTQTIRWQGNTVPTASTNKVDVFTFSLIRAASAWTVLGSATSHG